MKTGLSNAAMQDELGQKYREAIFWVFHLGVIDASPTYLFLLIKRGMILVNI